MWEWDSEVEKCIDFQLNDFVIVVLPDKRFGKHCIVIGSNKLKSEAKNSEHLKFCLLEIFVLKSPISHLIEAFNGKAVRNLAILVKLAI